MSEHAVLSPSAASRWMACTPSARFELQFPDRSSDASLEGTLAHEVAEVMLSSYINDDPEEMNKRLYELRKSPYFSIDLFAHVTAYANHVWNEYQGVKWLHPGACLLVEQNLPLTAWVPEAFGTSDAVIIADGMMEIIDLKFGKGVPVSAYENKQMMLYALGALHRFSVAYDIHTVRMTIHQPRLENVSSFDMQVEDLYQWAADVLKPLAQKAFAGEGDFVPGEHCRFCKGRAQCRAYGELNMSLAKYEFQAPQVLSEEQIVKVLQLADQFKRWLSDLEEYALTEAVENGRQWPGMKLVEGRSVRQYTDADEVARTLIQAGIPEAIIYERKLLGLTAMEKALSKKTFTELLSHLVVKPQGKPALVPVGDKRPELSSPETDFTNP